jgi:glycogen operon protein
LAGHAIEEKDPKGRPLLDDTFLLLINAHHEPRPFTLPAHKRGVLWQPVFDTALYDTNGRVVTLLRGGEQYDLEGRSLALLRLRPKV